MCVFKFALRALFVTVLSCYSRNSSTFYTRSLEISDLTPIGSIMSISDLFIAVFSYFYRVISNVIH